MEWHKDFYKWDRIKCFFSMDVMGSQISWRNTCRRCAGWVPAPAAAAWSTWWRTATGDRNWGWRTWDWRSAPCWWAATAAAGSSSCPDRRCTAATGCGSGRRRRTRPYPAHPAAAARPDRDRRPRCPSDRTPYPAPVIQIKTLLKKKRNSMGVELK